MRILVNDIELNSRWRVRLEWKLADAWVGCYWANHGGYSDVWICLLPCLPLHFYSIEKTDAVIPIPPSIFVGLKNVTLDGCETRQDVIARIRDGATPEEAAQMEEYATQQTP